MADPIVHDHTADVTDIAVGKSVSAEKVIEASAFTTSRTGVGNKPDFIVPWAVDTVVIMARFPVWATCKESKKWGTEYSKAAHLIELFPVFSFLVALEEGGDICFV